MLQIVSVLWFINLVVVPVEAGTFKSYTRQLENFRKLPPALTRLGKFLIKTKMPVYF